MMRVLLWAALLCVLLAACGSEDYRTLPDASAAPVFRNAQLQTLPSAEQTALGRLAAPALLASGSDVHVYVYTSDDTIEKVADFYSKQLLYRGWLPQRAVSDINNEPNATSFSFRADPYQMDVLAVGPLTTDAFGHLAPSLRDGVTPGASLLVVVTGHPA